MVGGQRPREPRRASANRGDRMSPWFLAIVLLAIATLASGCASSGSDSAGTSGSSAGSSTDASPAPLAPTPTERRATERRAAKRVVRTYYGDIDSGDYGGAWQPLSPDVQSSLGGYNAWRKGFETTDSTSATSVKLKEFSRQAAAVNVTVESSDTDVCGTDVQQRFACTWRLERQGHSRIATGISMSKESGNDPVTDASKCSSPAPTVPAKAPAPSTPTDDGSGVDDPPRGPSGADGTYNCADFAAASPRLARRERQRRWSRRRQRRRGLRDAPVAVDRVAETHL
jgi:hypothetical protein